MSIACCGHCSARWRRRMLMDKPPQPCLPYTEQEGMRRREDGRRDGRMEVWREAAQLCPPSPLPSRARIEVPQCRPPVPEIHTSPGVPRCFIFPQREGGDPRCNVHSVQAAEEALALQNRRRFSVVGVFILFFFCFSALAAPAGSDSAWLSPSVPRCG